MSKLIDIIIPALGDFDSIEVIEILVVKGDIVKKEDGLITLETDKASMDVPAPESGKIESITICLLYTSPSPRDRTRSRMPSSA